ncbi:MAG: LLM class flavin-dependent oxidoreductase [Actinobacteria bacterium]|nr:LLM class flavin-dependent oxidoreductase [Actinomycetota bacterium]
MQSNDPTPSGKDTIGDAKRPSVGILILPFMAADDIVAIAREADRIGYDYCLVADEGLHADAYAVLGAVAVATDNIRIGPMTNGYTRHPGVTATAVATLDDLSGGRALVTMLAGGSMTLAPLGIERKSPHLVVSEAVEAMRMLWSGETVTWRGETCTLDRARLPGSARSIPIWIASRGPKLLTFAGRSADGTLVTVKPDIGAAFAIVDAAAAAANRLPPVRSYLGRVCYTPQMLEGQRRTLPYVLLDSPRRVLDALGLDEDAIALVARALAGNRPELVEPLATEDLLRRYQVAGTPHECAAELRTLVANHRLDTLLIDVMATDLEENLMLLRDSYPILTGRLT